MVYYSVLKKIIDQPQTHDELVQSILRKAMSIVKECGIDYIMEHNEDHYFDVNNNEIIKLKLDLIVDNTAEKPFTPWYNDYALYNYTTKRINVIINNDKYKKVCIKDLTDCKLREINSGTCEVSKNIQHAKSLFNALKDAYPVGSFYQVCEGNQELFGIVTGDPYIENFIEVHLPHDTYGIYDNWEMRFGDKNNKKYIKQVGCGYIASKVSDINDIMHLSKDTLINMIYHNVNDDSCNTEYYDQLSDLCNANIKKSKKIVADAKERLKTATGKTELLKLQLAIAENEETIENCAKQLDDADTAKKNIGCIRNNLKKEISDFIDKTVKKNGNK